MVGAATVEALWHQPGTTVIALRHRARLSCAPGVRTVAGDITAPRLGLPDELLGEITDVVHCAAQVAWLKASPAMSATNIEGTQRVCEFAALAGARLVHVSTAFVELDLTADTPAPIPGSRNHPGAYLDSKRAAEEVVRTHGPAEHVIARIPGVLGDSRTGDTGGALQGFHRFVAAAVQGRIPAVPLAPDAVLDLLPTDVIGHALAALVAAPAYPELVRITAGPAAPTMARVAAAITETAGAAPPALLDAATLARRLSEAGTAPNTPAWRRVADLAAMCEVYRPRHAFPTDLGSIPGTVAPGTADVLGALAALTRYLAGQLAAVG
ncbi:hypothetical protein GCM10009738_84180 [Kitasatospora viridis]